LTWFYETCEIEKEFLDWIPLEIVISKGIVLVHIPSYLAKIHC
jgi:hypothetical protein